MNYLGAVLKNAPLVEVSIGVQYSSDLLTEVEIYRFHEKYLQESFPVVQNQIRLLDIVEEEEPSKVQPTIHISEFQSLPGRKFFISEDGTRLVQIQSNRFAFNWRAVNQGVNDYPSFENVLNEFIALLEKMNKFKNSVLPIDYLELTYIDHIEVEKFGTKTFDVDMAINNFLFNQSLRTFACEYSVWKKEIAGNLAVKFQSAYKNIDGKKLITMDSSCRGKYIGYQSPKDWFHASHEILKLNFFNSLTDKAKDIWRLA